MNTWRQLSKRLMNLALFYLKPQTAPNVCIDMILWFGGK